MLEMTERKKKILKAIINEYVMTAEPVGSRTLARRYDFGVSSATIRNETADLEAMGYLKKPHKSAGRIPSDKGYRFYVDTLMELKEISKQKQQAIEENYRARAKEIQEIIDQTSDMLSELTKYTSLVLSPKTQNSYFHKLKLFALEECQVLLVLITDLGLIQNKVITLPQRLSSSELQEIARHLNEKLHGLTLSEIDEELLSSLENELINRLNFLEGKLDLLKPNYFVTSYGTDKIYLGGTTNILDQPEFNNDIHKVKTVLNILEEEEFLRNILDTIPYEHTGIKITIGEENDFEEIKDCSIVTATYQLNGRPIGKIGVLGPTRMNYPNVVSIVELVTKVLNDLLADMNK
ncbi:heat-inducible transcriptional repressor HrcA [Fuchsiella alkaliacetigena]|uniref:heat-inducible transcriptional repressor HrcA n=1 Tax=Fuchsiella alkaliacetigena TaxID=957042 RepID=UPI00200A7124|nr:heat-inducible transcriptional repressor HrcA [Fuchsiella alkaliacetigena]MCK8825146.1 heat-inducible transcriptional repressor HrcA [Fuchsiella alkaliacetigena]